MTNETQPYIFISYSHKDSNTVLKAINALESNGYSVWYDNGIEAGTEWPEYIAERMMNCEVVVAFMSRNAQDSNNCRQEIHFALELKKDLLVVYLEDFMLSPGMRLRLSTLQAMTRSKFTSEEDFFAHLCSANILRPCKKALNAKADLDDTNNEPLHNKKAHIENSSDVKEHATERAERVEETKPTQTAPREKKPEVTSETKAKKEVSSSGRLLAAINAYNDVRGKTDYARFKFVKELTPKQMSGGVRVMAKNTATQSDIIAMVDDTLFGNGKSGYLLTSNRLYGAGALLDTFSLPLNDIVSYSVSGSNMWFDLADGSKKKVFFNNYCTCFEAFFKVYLRKE